MKKFFTAIVEIMESISKAKAAAHLSRMGRHAEAKAIMTST